MVEHYLDTVGVGGSKPPPRTIPPGSHGSSTIALSDFPVADREVQSDARDHDEARLPVPSIRWFWTASRMAAGDYPIIRR